MSAESGSSVDARKRARANLRVGLIMGSIALVAFFGVILRYWVFK